MENQTIRDTASELVAAMKDYAETLEVLKSNRNRVAQYEAEAVAAGVEGKNAEQRKATLATMFTHSREVLDASEWDKEQSKLTLDICQINWEAVKWEIRNNQNATVAQLDEVLAVVNKE